MPRASTNSRKGDRGRTAPVAALKRAKSAPKKPARAQAKANGSAGPPRAESRNNRATDRRTERVVHGGRVAGQGDAAPAVSRGKYVYCIIESGDPLRFGPIGIGGDPSDVYTVHFKNLAAV